MLCLRTALCAHLQPPRIVVVSTNAKSIASRQRGLAGASALQSALSSIALQAACPRQSEGERCCRVAIEKCLHIAVASDL